jgi:tetratricopeptide (TPR) repeat protein
VLYRLVEVTIKLNQFDEAIEYYSEYVQAAPRDNSRYILKYKIYRARGSSVDEQISILKEYLKQLNSRSWLKANAGYSTKKENGATVHCFRPDLYVFVKESFVVFEPAIIDPDEYEDMMDDLEYEEDTLDDIEIDLALTIKSSKLTGISLELEAYGDDISVEMTFSDIGKTVVDVEELEDMLQKARN